MGRSPKTFTLDISGHNPIPVVLEKYIFIKQNTNYLKTRTKKKGDVEHK
jgi:hypothetical protein